MESRTQLWLSQLGQELRAAYAQAGPCHDLCHVVRVSALAEQISAAEGVDVLPSVLAALLHDAGHAAASRAESDDHEIRSAQLSDRLLADRVPAATRRVVADAIAGRRFRKLSLPRSPVGAVLDDADNLDAIGHHGVARAFLWIGEHGRQPAGRATAGHRDAATLANEDLRALGSHWSEKLARLPAMMRTATGRRLADERMASMNDFLRGLASELSAFAA